MSFKASIPHNTEMSLKRVHSLGNVPFSWENSPGICKECPTSVGPEIQRLPPPPCPTDSPKVVGQHDLQVPLPPCPFQPPLRSNSVKGQKREDPFLAAYMECTKSVARHDKVSKDSMKGRVMSFFSCKNSCGVRDDGLVRVAHLPTISRSTSRESFRR